MKTAIYLRVSIDRTGEGLAVGRQREDCQRLCAERGWVDTVEYCDNDTSASKGVRREYERMLEDIRNGTIKAIVVWDLDRLHRRPIEAERFMELADEQGIALATVTGDVDLSTDNGRLFARIKGAVARAEVERKSARQKRALLQRAQAGKGWGTRAFGYAQDDGLEPREAAAVKEAFTTIIQGGSLGSIATRWNEAGLFTAKTGGKWTGSTVRRVLLNPRYAGIRAYDGKQYAAQWPAIVTQDVWKTVEGILTNPSRRVDNSRVRRHLMTALARCGVCGANVGVGTSGEKNRIRKVYTCKAEGCRKIQRDLDKVNKFIEGVVVSRLSGDDAEKLYYNQDCVDMDSLRLEAEALSRRKRTLAIQVAKGSMDDTDIEEPLTIINTRLNEIESVMLDANAASVFEGVVGTADVQAAWDALELDRKRTIIDHLMVVTINPAPRGRAFRPECIDVAWRNTH